MLWCEYNEINFKTMMNRVELYLKTFKTLKLHFTL